jgi:hypothetical protein
LRAVGAATASRGLYHANSVITSCQFLKHKALLSRGSVDRLELAQTDQYSDGDDKRYSLWFDVFTDSAVRRTILRASANR